MPRVDQNVVALFETSNGRTLHYPAIDADPAIHADALKITSRATEVTVRTERIRGGYEDCLDANNECRNISVHADEWHAGGKYVATIKGGCDGVSLSGIIMRHGSEADIDLGNMSDQSAKRTTNVRLNLVSGVGQKIRVRVLHAHQPVFENGPEHYELSIVGKGWFGHVYPILKAILALLRIKI